MFFIKTYHASQGIRLPYEADVDNRKVFVDRLPRFVKLADLKSYFSAFGRIEDIQLNLRMGSFSAFVVYKSAEAAKKAVDVKHIINGVSVRVKRVPVKKCQTNKVQLKNVPIKKVPIKKGQTKKVPFMKGQTKRVPIIKGQTKRVPIKKGQVTKGQVKKVPIKKVQVKKTLGNKTDLKLKTRSSSYKDRYKNRNGCDVKNDPKVN